MKNFVPRCVAALAGNGAILVSLGNYIASGQDSAILFRQAPLLGVLLITALLGVIMAYSALEHEEDKPETARMRLKWSARFFFGLIFGLGAALITVGTR